MKTIQKAIYFPKDVVEKIKVYQKENYIVSFTAAVIDLVLKGLEK